MGAVDYVSLDGAGPQGCKRLLAASRSGVVSSIDAENGEIGNFLEYYLLSDCVLTRFLAVWRHVYESEGGGAIDAVLRSKWGLVTVSGGGRLLRSWDVSSGSLRWETLTGLESEGGSFSYPLATEWRPGGVLATLVETSVGESLSLICASSIVAFCSRDVGGCRGNRDCRVQRSFWGEDMEN